VGQASVSRMVFSVRWYALSVSLSLGGDGASQELLCRRGVTVGTAKGWRAVVCSDGLLMHRFMSSDWHDVSSLGLCMGGDG
jgi:hypothetical protein